MLEEPINNKRFSDFPDFLDPFVEDNRKIRYPKVLVDPKFEQVQLRSLPSYDSALEIYRRRVEVFWDPQLSIKESKSLPLFLFSEDPVICPLCGNIDIVNHSLNRRWKCKNCEKTFTWGINKGLHFPLELFDTVLEAFLKGDDFARINGEVINAAERLNLKNITSISSEAVYSIVRCACKILAYFEPVAIRKLPQNEIKLGTVEMDYTPYALYTIGSRIKQLDLKKKNINLHELIEKYGIERFRGLDVRKRIFVYVTGAIFIEHRYPLPMVTDFSFDFKRSLECLNLMVKTFGCKPELIKCDGGGCHRKAIRMFLPDVQFYTRTKAQEYNIVNHIERYWRELKYECMKPYRFRSLETVQLAEELRRFHHIFFRPHSNLGGKTPAEHMGLKIPISHDPNKKWQLFLKNAYNVIAMEKDADLSKFFS